jgi:O-antigen/teichoic acid export membrane protein
MSKNFYGLMWIILSQVILLVVNLLLLRILTQQLSVADYGFYALCLTIVLFLRQVIYDPFSMVIAKEASVRSSRGDKPTTEFLVARYAIDKISLIIIIAGILIFFISYFYLHVNNYAFAFIICSLYLLSNAALGLYLNILNSIRERKSAAIFIIIDSLTKIILVLTFIVLIGAQANDILISIAIGSCVTFLIMRYYFNKIFINVKTSTSGINRDFYKFFLMSIPVFFPSILNSLKSVGDRWTLATWIGLDELAAYSVLLQIGYFPIILILGVIQTYIGPRIYQLCKNDNSEDLRHFLIQIILATFLFSVLVASIAYISSDIVFKIFIGENYRYYSVFLPVFTVAASISAGAAIMQNVIFGYFNTKTSSMIIIYTNIIGIIISLILSYLYKFTGAAIGLGLISLISFLAFSIIIIIKLPAQDAPGRVN